MVIDEAAWRQDVETYVRFEVIALAREARRTLKRQGGVRADQLRRCDAVGADGTLLEGCVKAYLPLGGRAPSEQPFAFVFRAGVDEQGRFALVLVGFGPRHPRRGAASAYTRAHTRIHGAPPSPRRRSRGPGEG